MALLFIDGFDAYGTDGQNVVSAMEAAGYTTFAGFSTDAKTATSSDTRTGIGYSMVPSVWTYPGGVTRNFPTASGLVTGFAVKLNASGFQDICAIGYNNYAGTSGAQLKLYGNGANGITLQTGDGAHLYSSAPNVLFQGVWQYVEIKYTPGSGTSYLEVRIDGVTVLRVSNQVLVNGTYAALVNYLSFSGDGAKNLQIDDWYVCDLSGSSFNDFLGDCVVHALLPSGDAGTNQFAQTGGNGAGHFTAINDQTPDGDQSYLSSNTTGQAELFTIPALPNDIVDVLAVGINISARKQAAGVGAYAAVLDVGGVESVSPEISSALAYVTQQSLFQAPPGGGSWTLTAAQNARFGVKIV
jgi:hypothetical protein